MLKRGRSFKEDKSNQATGGDRKEDDREQDDLDSDVKQEQAALRFAEGGPTVIVDASATAAASEPIESEQPHSTSSRWRRRMESVILFIRQGIKTYLTMDQDLEEGEGKEGEGTRSLKPAVAAVGICGLCMEDAKVRICCEAPYCDYCYGAKERCPNCGIALDHGQPILKHHDDDVEVKDVLECRRCLKKGFRRKCCHEYYCNECYYMTGFCPSCAVPVTHTGMSDKLPPMDDPGFWPVFWSYAFTWFVILSSITFGLFFFSNTMMLPKTVQGYTCYGILPSCSRHQVCMQWSPHAVGDGSLVNGGKEAVPNMTYWQPCDLDSTAKMMGETCVYDQELYHMSKQQLGYDFCASPFDQGYYVFEDDIETWPNGTTGWKTPIMKSAVWENVVNGEADRACGVAKGNLSLHFSGPNFRYAQTKPLDVSYGATVKFSLAFGSPFNALQTSACKAAYKGDVQVLYSIDNGLSWTQFADYNPNSYPDGRFHTLTITLPKAGCSSSTRFRFAQAGFTANKDNWAIDDVRIIHSFPSGWETSALMKSVQKETQAYVGGAQCCYGTVQCQTSRLDGGPLSDGYDSCSSYPGYVANERLFHGVELFVLIAFLVSLVGSFYHLFSTLVIFDFKTFLQRFKKEPKDSNGKSSKKPAPTMLAGRFRLRSNWKWRIAAAIVILVPLAVLVFFNGVYTYNQRSITLVGRYEALKGFGRGSIRVEGRTQLFLTYLIAVYLDIKDVYRVLSRVLCVLPRSTPIIKIDATPHLNILQIGHEVVASLDDVREITRFSYQWCRNQAIKYLVGSFPYTSLMLLMGLAHIYYPVYRVVRFVALVPSLLKAFYGPEWVIKFHWCFTYLFSTDVRHRKKIGLQLQKQKCIYLASYWALFGSILALLVLLIVHATWSIGGFFVSGIIGGVFGGLLGVAQGLPLVPLFVLTILDTGVYIRVTRKVEWPCMYRCKHWKGLHERDELIVLFVDDDLKFISLLKGQPPA